MTERATRRGAHAPERLELRPVRQDDLPVFLEHQMDPEASRMAAFTPRDPESFAQHWEMVLADGAVITRTIVLDGAVVGNLVSFLRGDRREVGYWIGREHWGKGIATGALRSFLAELPDRPLYAHVATHNAASLRVLEKCGFEVIGEDRDFVSGSGLAAPAFVLRLDT